VSEAVLDASALIAVLRREPGGAEVASRLDESSISTVNLTEVVTRLIEEGATSAYAREVVEMTPVGVVPFDEEMSIDAGILRSSTRSRGLSLGDRACLALARRMGVPALTADRRWAGLEVGVDIRLIGP